MTSLRERKQVDYTGKDHVMRTPGWLKNTKRTSDYSGEYSYDGHENSQASQGSKQASNPKKKPAPAEDEVGSPELQPLKESRKHAQNKPAKELGDAAAGKKRKSAAAPKEGAAKKARPLAGSNHAEDHVASQPREQQKGKGGSSKQHAKRTAASKQGDSKSSEPEQPTIASKPSKKAPAAAAAAEGEEEAAAAAAAATEQAKPSKADAAAALPQKPATSKGRPSKADAAAALPQKPATSKGRAGRAKESSSQDAAPAPLASKHASSSRDGSQQELADAPPKPGASAQQQGGPATSRDSTRSIGASAKSRAAKAKASAAAAEQEMQAEQPSSQVSSGSDKPKGAAPRRRGAAAQMQPAAERTAQPAQPQQPAAPPASESQAPGRHAAAAAQQKPAGAAAQEQELPQGYLEDHGEELEAEEEALLQQGAADPFIKLSHEYQLLQAMYEDLKDEKVSELEQTLVEADQKAMAARRALEAERNAWREAAQRLQREAQEAGAPGAKAKLQGLQERLVHLEQAAVQAQVQAASFQKENLELKMRLEQLALLLRGPPRAHAEAQTEVEEAAAALSPGPTAPPPGIATQFPSPAQLESGVAVQFPTPAALAVVQGAAPLSAARRSALLSPAAAAAAGGSGLKPAVMTSPGGAKRFGFSPWRRRSLPGPADASVQASLGAVAVGGEAPAQALLASAAASSQQQATQQQQQQQQLTSGIHSTARNQWELARALVPEGTAEPRPNEHAGSNAFSAAQAAAWGPASLATSLQPATTLGAVSAAPGKVRAQAELNAVQQAQDMQARPAASPTAAARVSPSVSRHAAPSQLPPLPQPSPAALARSTSASSAAAAAAARCKSLGAFLPSPLAAQQQAAAGAGAVPGFDNGIASLRISPGRFMSSAVRRQPSSGAEVTLRAHAELGVVQANEQAEQHRRRSSGSGAGSAAAVGAHSLHGQAVSIGATIPAAAGTEPALMPHPTQQQEEQQQHGTPRSAGKAASDNGSRLVAAAGQALVAEHTPSQGHITANFIQPAPGNNVSMSSMDTAVKRHNALPYLLGFNATPARGRDRYTYTHTRTGFAFELGPADEDSMMWQEADEEGPDPEELQFVPVQLGAVANFKGFPDHFQEVITFRGAAREKMMTQLLVALRKVPA